MRQTTEAYAKINLTLDITGVREDGYHLLRSVMQSISLSDTVEIQLNEKENGITVVCSDEDVPADEENIAHKAARLFFEKAGITDAPGVLIVIRKRIPMQAGLGGGSTDAAAVLKLLNSLCKTDLSEAQLAEIGVKAGADVPFCICGGTRLAEGIGEQLVKLPPLPNCFILLAKPEQGAGTKEIFHLYDKARSAFHPSSDALIEALHSGRLEEASRFVGNVLEEVTASIVTEITLIKSIMRESGALGAAMTGSGSAVFGIFDDELKLNGCKAEIEKIKGVQTFLCRPMNV